MQANLHLLDSGLLRFAKRVFHEPHVCLLRRLALPVLLHLLDEAEYHLGCDQHSFCYGWYEILLLVIAVLSGGSSAVGSVAGFGGFATSRLALPFACLWCHV